MPASEPVNLKEKVRHLPDKPGVYLMKDRLGRIIYAAARSGRVPQRAVHQRVVTGPRHDGVGYGRRVDDGRSRREYEHGLG